MRILISILMLLSHSAYAARYTYFPDSQLYPGAGFDIFRPDNAFPDCVDHDGVESGNHDGGTGTSDNSHVSLKLLKTREDFYQFVNFSASMGGSYKFFSGSASYKLEQEDKFHSDSITWGVIFETNFGIYRLKNPRLKAAYKGLPLERLKNKCGREVVLKSRKAVSVFATFTLKNVEESHRREITSKASVNMSGAVWDANMQASYTNILRTAMARSELELEVFAVGGRGIVDMKELISTGSQPGESAYEVFARVPRVLETYLGTLTEAQAAPVEFITSDITSLTNEGDGGNESLHAKQLGRMYLGFLDAEADYQRIRNIFTVDRSRYQLSNSQITYLEGTKTTLNQAMNTIESSALKCRDPKEPCKVPDINLPVVNWPSPVINKCERQRENAVALGCISGEQANQSRLKNEVPACVQHDIDSRFELIGWAPCRP